MRNLFEYFDYRLEMVVGLAVAAVDRLVLMSYDYHLRMDYILLKYLKVEQLVRLVEQLDPIIN